MDINQIVKDAKAAGHRVFKAKIAGLDCVYRSLTRKEFRDLQKKLADKAEGLRKTVAPEAFDAQAALLKEEGEEQIVIKASLVPKFDTELDLVAVPAGLIPSLSELIMTASGFGQDVEPQEL